MPSLDLGDLEEVDYDPFKRQGLMSQFQPIPESQPLPDLTEAARQGKLGTLSAGDPSLGDRLAGGFSNAMGLLGATPTGQKNAYEFGQNITGLIPGVSNVVSADDASRDFSSGNYLSGILNTAAAVPIPVASSALKAGTRDFSKELKAFGPAWKKAPVIDAAGNVVHGAITADKTIGGPLGILDEEGNLTKGLLSYHGSSADWDKVDLSKIGTGEGTLDEGWGFYSATHPKVGEYYRGMGNQASLVDAAGNPVNTRNSLNGILAWNALEAKGGDFDKALAHTQKGSKFDFSPGSRQAWADANSLLSDWQEAGHTFKPPDPGHKYMVAVQHDPDTFLDFNKKITEQSPAVQEAVKKLGDFHPDATGKDVHDWIHADEVFKDMGEDLKIHNNPREYVQGSGEFDEPIEPEQYKAAADRMKAAGFPGVKYLDNASEEGTAARKTYNYVTYDDAIKVLKKFGMAGLGGASLGNMMLNHPNMPKTQVDEDQFY